jgi:hypothetical protein
MNGKLVKAVACAPIFLALSAIGCGARSSF